MVNTTVIERQDLLLQSPLPGNLRVQLLRPSWGIREWLAIWSGITRPVLAEQELAQALAARFRPKCPPLLFDSARTALMLGLLALGLEPGDEVIIPSFVCRTVAQAVFQAGCRPILADIEDDFNITSATIEACVSARTKAVVVVHQFGKMADVVGIKQVAEKYGLYVVDDTAVAIGAEVEGRPAGRWGDFGILSFNQGKVINAAGGGALLTDSAALYRQVVSMRLPAYPSRQLANKLSHVITHELFKRYFAPVVAYQRARQKRPVSTVPEFYRQVDRIPAEYAGAPADAIPPPYLATDWSGLHFIPARIHPAQAAIAGVQLTRLDDMLPRMAANAGALSQKLAGVPELSLPQGHWPTHNFAYYTVIINSTAKTRYDLAAYLSARGIETQWTFYPLHLQPRFRGCRWVNLDNTERLWSKVLSLPVAATVSPQQTHYVAGCVVNFFG